MKSDPTVIFTRTYDLITWLIPHTLNFPRSQRFVVTKRLQDAALDFQERIIEANRLRGRARLERLRQADAALDKVRLYLRLAVRHLHRAACAKISPKHWKGGKSLEIC